MMKLRRVNALAKKEFIQIIRDPRSMGLAIAIPVLLVFLFGYALSLDVDNVPTVIWDQDNSQVSRDFILDFHNSRYFEIKGYYDNYRDMMALIDRNKTLMAMVIPKHFSKYIQSDQTAPVQFLVDGSDSNTALIATGYLRSVVSNYNLSLIRKSLAKFGRMDPFPVQLCQRAWFNPNRESRYFVVPGVIAVVIMVISALLTSLTVAKEWERGTMEQLISTPVRSSELIMGKFIPYFVIGFIDLLIAVTMAEFVFHVPFRGNLLLLFALSSLFLAGALMLGILISIFAKSQLLASQIAIMATFIPTFLLSGFMYAIFNMPKAIQVLTYFIPATYFITILRGIYLKGIGMRDLWPEVLALAVFSFVVVFLANKSFKKKVA